MAGNSRTTRARSQDSRPPGPGRAAEGEGMTKAVVMTWISVAVSGACVLGGATTCAAIWLCAAVMWRANVALNEATAKLHKGRGAK